MEIKKRSSSRQLRFFPLNYPISVNDLTPDGSVACSTPTWVNSYHLTDVQAPWGGYKQSGIGRGLGPYGIDEYQEVKQINMNLDPKPMGWF